jgi:phosphopantothenoylcysteine synthetase/decarboxylase
VTDRASITSEPGVGVPAEDGREPAVRVVDLVKEFTGVRALGGLTFDVPRGELTSIIGPSGCGKTTTLKIVAGLVDATSGRVEVDGVIATAAVMDYRVASPASGKVKRASEPVLLEMLPSTDVLGTLKAAANGQWFLGFAAETDDVEANGRGKLEKKGLDFLFANPVARAGEASDTGFSVPTNGGVLLRRQGEPLAVPVMSKAELARHLWTAIV